MRPTRDIGVLTRRQDAVEFLIKDRNAELLAAFRDSLKHVANVVVRSACSLRCSRWRLLHKYLVVVQRVLGKFKANTRASVLEWNALYKVCA
jgi:hypothetical protein